MHLTHQNEYNMSSTYQSADIEVNNCILGDMLALYVGSVHGDWVSVLHFLTFAYNTSAEATVCFFHFFLLCMRKLSHTLDNLYPYRPDSSEHPPACEETRTAEQPQSTTS